MSASPVTALIQVLEVDEDVEALVSDRIYRGVAPPHAPLPRVTLNNIGGPQYSHMGGASPVADTRIQVDCWGEYMDDAHDVATAVRLAMLGAHGSAIGDDDLEVSFIVLDTEFDASEPVDGRETLIARIIQEYRVGYKISVPA